MYDVIIIGAGPAGLSAAITTANSGLKTLVLEKNKTIGLPLACGEGISKEKYSILNNMPKEDQVTGKLVSNLGLELESRNITLIEREIGMQRFFFGTKGVSTANLQTMTINRPLFDQIMAENAIEAGAEVKTENNVVKIAKVNEDMALTTSSGITYNSKIVIACDGPSSRISQKMGLKKPENYVLGTEIKIEGVFTDALDFYFDFERFQSMHYGWVFPKLNSTNIGLVAPLGGKPSRVLKTFIASLSNQKITDAKVITKIGGLIPASGPIEKTYTDNFLVAGDAAGMTNSIFYGGISIAIHSGDIAGQTVIKAHEYDDFSEDLLKKYEEAWRKMPYVDPLIREAHDILYTKLTVSDINDLGSVLDGWNITELSFFQKLMLFKLLIKPRLLKKFPQLKQLAKGFSISRDWGF